MAPKTGLDALDWYSPAAKAKPAPAPTVNVNQPKSPESQLETPVKKPTDASQASPSQPTPSTAVSTGATAPDGETPGWDTMDDLDMADAPAGAPIPPELLKQAQALMEAEGPAALEKLVQSVAADTGGSGTQKEPVAPAPQRELNALEVEKSVDGAVKAKEQLATQSLQRAREEVLARRKAAQKRLAEEEASLKAEETRLSKMQDDIAKGSDDERHIIEKLRAQLEEANREINRIERDTATKKLAMARAVDAYTASEELMAQKREIRRKLNEEMTELILSTGRAKDEKLNKVLCEV